MFYHCIDKSESDEKGRHFSLVDDLPKLAALVAANRATLSQRRHGEFVSLFLHRLQTIFSGLSQTKRRTVGYSDGCQYQQLRRQEKCRPL